jgi:P27 family predicted phage terminase small subunit
MGRRGPQPQPTTLKLLRGNPGKRALNDAEPQAPVKMPRCPKHLKGEARKRWNEWGRTLHEMGVLTLIDAAAFELLCKKYAECLEHEEKVAQGGPVWIAKGAPGELPAFKISPYVKLRNIAEANLLRLIGHFGMSPSTRSAIKVDQTAGADPLDDFLERNA